MDALKAGRRSIADGVDNPHVELDMEQHGLSSLREYWQLVFECIQAAYQHPETEKCYRPTTPQKSTKHGDTKGLTMWAFSVYHDLHNKDIYFKFCLRKLPKGKHHYLHIDCHDSKRK